MSSMVVVSRLLHFSVALFCMYLFFGIYLYAIQDSLLYHPDTQDFFDCPQFAHYEKVIYEGTRMYYLAQESDSIIVQYHGNAGSACGRFYLQDIFEPTGASVLFVEYSGFANDTISPDKSGILENAQAVTQFVSAQNYSQVIAYGESLGSAVASYHAYVGKVDALILISPFTGMADVVQYHYRIYPATFLLRDTYDSIYWLSNFEGDVLILHGAMDTIVPSQLSQDLAKSLSNATVVRIEYSDKGHNDMWSDEFVADIRDFLESILD